VAEALNAWGLEHPGDVIIEPSSYTPDGTPVFTVPPELRASHISDRGANSRAQVSEQGRSFADGRPCIRVRSITTGVFNELMIEGVFTGQRRTNQEPGCGGVDVETHRTIWDGGPSTWRHRGGSRRACVRWRSWVLTSTTRAAKARCRCNGQRLWGT
jgi:hypothetical protein